MPAPGSPGASACKRGVAYGYHSEADMKALKPGISWWYNWAFLPDTGVRTTFANVPVDECELMLGRTAAEVYGFDWERLSAIAAKIGPTHAEVHQPITPDEWPVESLCGAFDADAIIRAW